MPTELGERQKSILEAVIREYVATAEPVASSEIVRKYRLPYSSATVRGELLALDEAGYLTQPHTSAGRVPTDKGYRFYINRLEDGEDLDRHEGAMLRGVRDLNGDPREFLKRSSRLLAELTRNFVLAGFPEQELFYKSGIREVMREPEFSDLALMQEFGALTDTIEDELLRRFAAEEFAEPRIFIGGENPIPEARRYSMIVSAVETPFGEESVVAIIGPKRMDYEHNLALLRHFRELLTQ